MEKTCTHYIDACPNTRACEASPADTYEKSCCNFAFCGHWYHAGFEKIYNTNTSFTIKSHSQNEKSAFFEGMALVLVIGFDIIPK